MTDRRIPVLVLTGFLGSGKTSLLNHLLARSGGTRIGVVVNDFGQVNVDAMSVAGQVDSMVSLAGGCLCCVTDASELDGMLDRLAEPNARIDVIVIEASGLAEPQSIVRMLLRRDNPATGYGGLVDVVDAAEFAATRARHPDTDRHLRFADLVVLNKTDRVSPGELESIRNVVDELSAGTPILPAVHGAVDPALLFDVTELADDGARQLSFEDLLAEEDDHTAHAHAAYSSVAFSSAVPLHPRRFAAFLDERPTGLYRVKGHAYFDLPDYTGRFVVHTVGGYLRYNWTPWPRGIPRGSELVLIGTELDAAALTERLRSCQRRDGEQVDEHAMLPVLQYTD